MKVKISARWMAELESELVKLSPAHAGKINWDAAAFHFHQGKDPFEAAAIMAAHEAPMDRRF